MTDVAKQRAMLAAATKNASGLDELMLEMLYGPNPITDDELKKLIEKRPAVYSRFAGYIGTRKGK